MFMNLKTNVFVRFSRNQHVFAYPSASDTFPATHDSLRIKTMALWLIRSFGTQANEFARLKTSFRFDMSRETKSYLNR